VGGPVQPSHCFAAADVNARTDAAGSFLLLYACFSGGTPRQDEFWFTGKNTVDIKTLAKHAPTDDCEAKPARYPVDHGNCRQCPIQPVQTAFFTFIFTLNISARFEIV
jgi:hypothetical protein